MRTRSLWFVLLASSPLAYFAATLLESKLPHDPPLPTVSRQEAADSAIRFATALGWDVRGWTAHPAVERHSNIIAILRRFHSPAIERVAAPATIDMVLGDATQHRWIKVNVAPSGRVVGFIASRPPAESPALAEEVAFTTAEASLRTILGPDSPFQLSHSATHLGGKTGDREFVWEAAVPDVPGAKATFHVEVVGSQVTSESTTINAGGSFAASAGRTQTRMVVIVFVLIFYFFALAVYALVRYVQRSMEREISHRRTLLVIGLFAASGIVGFTLNGVDVSLAVNGEPATGIRLLFLLSFALAIPGVAFGIAYGAGEGDLREAYPGKLVSVDAFLSGKWLSANVARSILAGGALAGWLLLVQQIVLLIVRGTPLVDASDLVGAALLKSPLAQSIADMGSNLTILTGFGLMLPLTLLHSRIRKPWVLYCAVFVLACAAGPQAVPGHGTGFAFPGLLATYSIALCLPFFAADLLASVSCLTALTFVSELVRKSAVSPEWHTIAYSHVLPAALVFLAAELYFARRGRLYTEAEVRPVYARHLAERLALTAEIGAARLAQVRLLPDAPPAIAGLSIAGSCTPAREVGGDFFDYYALDDHRLGIFVAEGGNRELGSAMAIALAKGYLLYTTRLDLTPVEVLTRLRATLARVLLGENAPMTVIYAVIDARTGSLRYARSGASPRIAVNGMLLAEEIVADRSGGCEIRHGVANLAPNDALFVYTDGWARLIAERHRAGADAFLRTLERHADAAALHQSAIDAALKQARGGIDDDVTAVVVRREAAAFQEAVGGIA